jgi:long-chain fatty acid transport protein
LRFFLSLVLLVATASTAVAGGMFLPARGARPLGRGGAFNVGDDAGVIAYNPSAIGDIEGGSFLLDVGLVFQRVGYDRVDSGGNPQPHVDGSIDILPIPTISFTWKPKKVRWFTLGVGIYTPYLGLNSYPENGPQRYSSISLAGSLIAVLQFTGAFRVHEHVYVGIALQNLILRFKTKAMLSACTELNCAPEDPGFDTLADLDASSYFTPSANASITVVYPDWRAGFTLQLPYWIHATGNVLARLPTDPFFTNATITGTAIDAKLTLPLILRWGFEARWLKRVRFALDIDYEAWSMQNGLTLEPQGIYIDGIPGVGRYYLKNLTVNRPLVDSVALRLGVEGEVIPRRLWLRGGYFFESSATTNEAMNVLFPDGLKNALTVGIGVQAGPVRFDLGYAHIFYTSRTVTTSQSYQLNPVQPSRMVPVGNGTYTMDTDVVSVGLDARFW